MRWPDASRGRRGHRPLCRSWRHPDRCVAWRPACGCRRALRAAPGRLPAHRRPRAQRQTAGWLRRCRLGLSRTSSPVAVRRPRLECARGKVRSRRRQGRDADVLRQRSLLQVPGASAVAWHQHSDRAWHLSHPFLSRCGAVRRAMRGVNPGADRRTVRRARCRF